MRTKTWHVEISISERDDDQTFAEARLATRDTTSLNGTGVAKRNPSDPSVPEIGDELAAARALSDLANRLMRATAEDIEAITHQDVHLHT